MVHPFLKTFITVVDCGSFLKASEKLFISTPAVMKQINQLEKFLNLHLLIRTNKGIKTTVEGLSIYNDAKKLIKLSDEAIARAENLKSSKNHKIRIGSSLLYPANILIELWNKVGKNHSDFHLRIVPFEDSEILSATYVIGSKCDLVVGAYNATKDTGDCSFLEIGNYSFCIAMSHSHILATKNNLQPADLAGQKLLIMKEGNSPCNDEIRHLLQNNYPNVILEDVPFHYGLNHFNRCEEENCLLLTLDGWKNVHPSLITIPFDVDVKLPYGILYSNHANKSISLFLKMLQDEI